MVAGRLHDWVYHFTVGNNQFDQIWVAHRFGLDENFGGHVPSNVVVSSGHILLIPLKYTSLHEFYKFSWRSRFRRKYGLHRCKELAAAFNRCFLVVMSYVASRVGGWSRVFNRLVIVVPFKMRGILYTVYLPLWETHPRIILAVSIY